MRVIGHRGAAGLELENTLAGLSRAKALGVDGVEFDLRITKDRQLVLCHDPDLIRVAGQNIKIQEATLAEIKAITLPNGEQVPTLDEALDCLDTTWAILDVKSDGCADELFAALDRHPQANVTVASFIHHFAASLQERRPELDVFLGEHFKPTEVVRVIRRTRTDGVDLNMWLLNPFTYWLMRRRNLKIMVYTVNSRFLVSFIQKLYPEVAICTDYPERFIHKKARR